MSTIGSFVHTTRSADLHYVLRSNTKMDELRICHLRDGVTFWLPSKHVIAEDHPAERFREHVRAVIEEAKTTGAVTQVKFPDFSEYLSEYIRLAINSGSQYMIDATVNFLIIVLNEQDCGEYKRSFGVFYLDVCWFCYQLGMDNPTEALIRSRLTSLHGQSRVDLIAGVEGDEV